MSFYLHNHRLFCVIRHNMLCRLSRIAGSLPPSDPMSEDLDIASVQDRSVIDQRLQLASRHGRQQPELVLDKEREGASTVVEQTSVLLPVFKIDTSAHPVADDSNQALARCQVRAHFLIALPVTLSLPLQKTLIEEPCRELPSVVVAPLATAEEDILSVALEME
jgi:hypothetical protein